MEEAVATDAMRFDGSLAGRILAECTAASSARTT
jgi:hypothetical protein